jgi:hypothetical protein
VSSLRPRIKVVFSIEFHPYLRNLFLRDCVRASWNRCGLLAILDAFARGAPFPGLSLRRRLELPRNYRRVLGRPVRGKVPNSWNHQRSKIWNLVRCQPPHKEWNRLISKDATVRRWRVLNVFDASHGGIFVVVATEISCVPWA